MELFTMSACFLRFCASLLAVLLLPISGWVLAESQSQAETPSAQMESVEQGYTLKGADSAALDRAYATLVHTTLMRLKIARSTKLSPESKAVEEKLSSLESNPTPDYSYDPVALTVAAGLETRAYDRGAKEEWQTLSLSLPAEAAESRFYTKDVPAHARLGDPVNNRLFLLFNASFSTWERGSWINKSIALLRQEFGNPHFVVFAGFLSPEFLNLQSSVPALGGALPARDLLPRLRHLVAQLKADGKIPEKTEVCLLGFSGGANLVISLLAEDERQKRRGEDKPLLSSGIAFSPILDLPSSFEILDRSTQLLTQQGFPAAQALTSPFKDNTLFAALRGSNPFEADPYLQMTHRIPENEPKRRELAAHFYREFEVEDLATVMTAPYTGMERLKKGLPPYSYHKYYRETVFPEHQRRFQLDGQRTFEEYAKIEPELEAIRAPLYLVFSQDDPVLAKSGLLSAEQMTERCREVLRKARLNSSIRVFSPAYGAHLGYILDNAFLKSVFRAQIKGDSQKFDNARGARGNHLPN
jgi:hypothetical protein